MKLSSPTLTNTYLGSVMINSGDDILGCGFDCHVYDDEVVVLWYFDVVQEDPGEASFPVP